MKTPFSRSLLVFLLFAASAGHAAVTLLDKDDWKVQFGGFVELDAIRDSKRSLTEVEGNSPIDRPGSWKGENGRTQFSLRNSRFAFTVLPPVSGDVKSKGYMEFDLLGYDPSPSQSAPSNSESGFYTNPTLRVRHAYLSAESNGWQVLAGQTWSLFGWVPTYVITTASVPPGPGIIYQRTPQITGMKTLGLGEKGKLVIGASIARPSQRDSSVPNFDAGIKYSFAGWSSGFSAPSSDIKAEPLSVGLSGTLRHYEVAKSASVDDGLNKVDGSAIALNALIPLIPSQDGTDTGNTLTLTGEVSSGKGYADSFPGWSGNLSQMALSGSTIPSATQTNLDAGQGGYDSSNDFQLVKLNTWNAQLQYHLPSSWHSFVTLGHAELWSSNVKDLNPVTTGAVRYDRSKLDFINFFHDFSAQIRGAIEYAKLTTHYVDTVSAHDDRYEINAYFRF